MYLKKIVTLVVNGIKTFEKHSCIVKINEVEMTVVFPFKYVDLENIEKETLRSQKSLNFQILARS